MLGNVCHAQRTMKKKPAKKITEGRSVSSKVMGKKTVD